MLMTDDTGWNDFGCYSGGGAALGHPTPNNDVRQADYAVEYIKKHAKDDKPFFMDVNFMKMHNPTNAKGVCRQIASG